MNDNIGRYRLPPDVFKTTTSTFNTPLTITDMTNKTLVTIVTDNRLVADTIATAVGATSNHDNYYIGNGYAVTWTNGCIIEATFKPGEKFVLASGQDMRQMYAHHFQFKMRNYDEILGWEKSKEDSIQLEVIKALWSKSHMVVNAMSPCLDGELSFLNLYWYLRQPVKVLRAWLPRLRKAAIVKAVKYGAQNPAKYEKWLGEQLVNHFIEADASGQELETIGAEPTEEVKPGDTVTVDNISFRIVDREEKPLYSMLTLWMDSCVELGYEFEKTYAIAYTLYAKGLVSFPSLYQNGVPESVAREMERNMRVLEYNGVWGNLAKEVAVISRRNVFRDGETAYNGHGIVTTGLHPIGLSRDEERLYNLIVKRVIEAFKPLPGENSRKKKNRKFRKGRSAKKS